MIHNRGEVSKTTREKILKIIAELEYQPNLLASALASKINADTANNNVTASLTAQVTVTALAAMTAANLPVGKSHL